MKVIAEYPTAPNRSFRANGSADAYFQRQPS